MGAKVKGDGAFKRVDKILETEFAKVVKNLSAHITVQCEQCKVNFYLNNIKVAPKVDFGVISNAHGDIEGFQFRFKCPRCGVLLRVDQDEPELRVWAKTDANHS